MSLSESILQGVQKWLGATARDFSRSRGKQRSALGKQLLDLPQPVTLSEAKVQLAGLLEVLPETAAKRAQDLLHAIASAESRDGISAGSLVDSLLVQEIDLDESVQQGLGFSLAPA